MMTTAGRIGWPVLAGMTTFFALHLLVWRWRPANDPRIVLLTGLAVGSLAVSAWLSWVGSRGDPVQVCALLWIDIALLVLYFFLYAGVARSVSVTLLARLRREPGPLPASRLTDEYVRSQRFEDRLELMARHGLIHVTAGRVLLTDKGRRWALAAKRLMRLVGTQLEG